MNARAKLSPVAAELAKVAERRRTLESSKAKLVAERAPLQDKSNAIWAKPRTTEEHIDDLLENTYLGGQRYLDDVAAFASRSTTLGVARLSHESTVASEIGPGGHSQSEASAGLLAFLSTFLPEPRAQLKAALVKRIPATPGALSVSERKALVAPIAARLAEIDGEIEAIDAELAELSFQPAV